MTHESEMTGERLTISALRVEQPIGAFYQAVIPWETLTRISYADIRAIDENEERQLDRYIGIQRKLDRKRVKEISKYVEMIDATFPTSIVLSIEEKHVSWNEETKQLAIFPTEGIAIEEVAKILDGQHRIEGMKEYSGQVPFELPVTIFVGADVATQANIFATVNLAQTKVNRSLVYDLFEYETSRSPQKSCHEIAVSLDQYESSPFFQRIKRLGTATPGRDKELLTQAVVVESLLHFISRDPWEDRNRFLKSLFAKSYSEGRDVEKFIFRPLWLAEKDDLIAAIIMNLFRAVASRWPTSWNDFDRKGNVLPKSNGFRALMRYLRPAYKEIVPEYQHEQRVPDKSEFLRLLKRVELEDSEFDIETFPPGTSGEAKLFKILDASINTEETK